MSGLLRVQRELVTNRALPTCSSLMATQELGGNPCSMGTRNCRQPDQWPMSSIMQMRLKMRMKTLAMLRNCKVGQERRHVSNQLIGHSQHLATSNQSVEETAVFFAALQVLI